MSHRKSARSRHHEVGSGNVYKDLRVPDPDSMLVKAKLVSRIAELLQERKLTQSAASDLLGVPQPKLSTLLRGQFRGFSERKLMDLLTLLGSDIEIVIRPAARPRKRGSLSVVFPR